MSYFNRERKSIKFDTRKRQTQSVLRKWEINFPDSHVLKMTKPPPPKQNSLASVTITTLWRARIHVGAKL